MTGSSHFNDDEDLVRRDHAKNLCRLGIELVEAERIPDAERTFEESIQVMPSSEGYRLRGWIRSLRGEFQAAINDCMKAIRIDEDDGHPYHDIGVYLMQLGRLEQALVWLKQAKDAAQFQNRHSAYLNSGHAHGLLGRKQEALADYVKALELSPENRPAREAIAAMEMDFS